jgi:hypothetical protein
MKFMNETVSLLLHLLWLHSNNNFEHIIVFNIIYILICKILQQLRFLYYCNIIVCIKEEL